MNNFLKVENLVKDYKTGDITLRVLKGIFLEVYEGEILGILGPSGAGKSTLLHIMGFLERPTDGDVMFRGKKLSQISGFEQSLVRNREFGFVFQLYHLLPEFNVLENTMLPLIIRYSFGQWALTKKECKKRAVSLLDRLGLSKRLHHKPNQLSGGERQRVAIARALVGDPQIVFCDEPTGSLDQTTSAEIQSLILSLNKELKKTFVIVTHDPDIAGLAYRQLKMADGRIV